MKASVGLLHCWRQHFCVKHNRSRLVRQLLEHISYVGGRNRGILLHTAIDQEALEASHTLFHQRFQVRDVPRYETAIKANIHPALASGTVGLYFGELQWAQWGGADLLQADG